MQNDVSWTSQYYSEERDKRRWRSANLSGHLSFRPASRAVERTVSRRRGRTGRRSLRPEGASPAARWRKLVEGFTGGDPEIQKGLKALYDDQKNWPEGRQQYRVKPEIQEFICKAMEAGNR